MSLLRQARRVLLPTRGSKILGNYPVSDELAMIWKKKKDCPGGMITHTVSQYQQKVVWQFLWSAPERWFWRLAKWFDVGLLPVLFFYILIVKTEHDAETFIRNKNWY